jgi:hypothetical protein
MLPYKTSQVYCVAIINHIMTILQEHKPPAKVQMDKTFFFGTIWGPIQQKPPSKLRISWGFHKMTQKPRVSSGNRGFQIELSIVNEL